MSTRGAIGVIAGLLLLAGVVFGFVPASAGGVSCGSGFTADYSAAKQADVVNGYSADLLHAGNPLLSVDKPDSVVARCESAIGTRRLIAWSLAGVGALGLLFLVLTIKSEPTQLSAVPAPEGAERQS